MLRSFYPDDCFPSVSDEQPQNFFFVLFVKISALSTVDSGKSKIPFLIGGTPVKDIYYHYPRPPPVNPAFAYSLLSVEDSVPRKLNKNGKEVMLHRRYKQNPQQPGPTRPQHRL